MASRSDPPAPIILRPQLIQATQGVAAASESASEGVAALPCAWQCDLSNDSLRWSNGVFDLFGIARGSRIDRRDIVAMYTDESRELLERLRSEAIASCGSFTFEAQIRRLDGQLRWMQVTADVACSNGRAVHLYGQKRDITDEMTLVATRL